RTGIYPALIRFITLFLLHPLGEEKNIQKEHTLCYCKVDQNNKNKRCAQCQLYKKSNYNSIPIWLCQTMAVNYPMIPVSFYSLNFFIRSSSKSWLTSY